MTAHTATVIGAGLAGSEAAFQLAVRGVHVSLHEMRPDVEAPAHRTAAFAELVCSNSFKADVTGRPSAPAMLKEEAAVLGSLVLACARATAVGAGTALAVDRERFSSLVTTILESHPNIDVTRGEVTRLPSGTLIVATGPLTSPGLSAALSALLGDDRLSFYDAAAPIVDGSTLDRAVCFPASRHDKGGGRDYLNCPLDRDRYDSFVDALVAADRVERREFETDELFGACQPIEEVARSGRDAPRHGALRPVGLVDPATGKRPWAVLQLRPEDENGSAYNLVGCQTNLTFPEQQRVFRLVPGLESASFLRYGVMHRNTFVDSPRLLAADLSLRSDSRIRLAGQLTGTEGYLEAAATGLVAALGAYGDMRGSPPPDLPRTTALGSLLAYATDPQTSPYQPMHVNFGLLPPLVPHVRERLARHAALADRGREAIKSFLRERPDLDIATAARAVREATA